MTVEDDKPVYNRFQRHTSTLFWKSYLQRQRRWRILALETLFAACLYTVAVFIAKPVFMTPLEAIPKPPLTSSDIIASLDNQNILGYAPNVPPFTNIMSKAAERLGVETMSASTEDDLNNMLYNRSQGTPINNPIIWIIWKEVANKMWRFSIRSTERARYATRPENTVSHNPHLRSGFLAVQLAVSEALLEHVSMTPPQYELSLVSMPVSPLMQENRVRDAISGILLCFTLAMLPPVLETEAIVVKESINRFKRALRLRNVDYSSMYFGWLLYAYLTVLPVCLLGSTCLLLIFRWIHLLYSFIILVAYVSVMIMLAMIMSMFHDKAWVAIVWTSLFTLMQMFIAELIIHHKIDLQYHSLTFFLHLLIPPLGLEHGFNEFALLQTGQSQWQGQSVVFTIFSWVVMIAFYFSVLMLLQRTVKQIAIGGEVSWKSILFKKIEDNNRLHRIENPSGQERDKLQEVDELVAKAISMRNVSKSIMDRPVLSNVTLDIYRGEFTMLYAELIQMKMMTTFEDLITGLTLPDKGTINILGEDMRSGRNLMTMQTMMGYCHRNEFLIDDLTVEEHFIFFISLSLWNETSQYVSEYGHLRSKHLLKECGLEGVKRDYVRNLDAYYRAQLCWAIALLLEPRIIIIPHFTGKANYTAVIKDKIMQYRRYITLIKISYTTIYIENADRIFIFDNRSLLFGGTPAYLFFKYGRDYRIRITFRNNRYSGEKDELLEKASEAGATIRAHLGTLLILRLPTRPTAKVAEFIKTLEENSNQYGIMSTSVSIPDSEEVVNRAIFESRVAIHGTPESHELSRTALDQIAAQTDRPCRENLHFKNFTHLSFIGQKFFAFYQRYQVILIITVLSAVVAGIFIGLSLCQVLNDIEQDPVAKQILHGDILTVEALEQKTTLVLKSDNSRAAQSIANAYVLSETNASEKEVENMAYTALQHTESVTEYLVTRAIDSPQHYVYMYAYGMDVSSLNDTLSLKVLYSPIHYDHGAAARSLARAYMALIRHFSMALDASIQVTDDPLALDLTPWVKYAEHPPLFIQFLLILTISHMILIPSLESGFVRHTQCYTRNFSPIRYWFSMFICDLMLYWMLVAVMTGAMIGIMILVAPFYFGIIDLAIVTLMLAVYGIGCIPQAYLFSLGPRAALNSMIFIMFNIVFGETTVLAKLFYGNALNYALNFLSFSPQFNMAYAFVKIKKIFLYNSECNIFKRRNLCSSKTLHKCCPKCGVLQQCFTKQYYIYGNAPGVRMEIFAMFTIAFTFTTLLLIWEYRYIQRFCSYVVCKWIYYEAKETCEETLGVIQEKADVMNKRKEMKSKSSIKKDTFGEYLLACNVSQKRAGIAVIQRIYFGIGKGEALALSGLLHHGRLRLCELVAGLKLPSGGRIWTMSKWSLNRNPYKYSRQISLACEHNSLPHWMTVYDALTLIAVLRGVPRDNVGKEISNYIDALNLHNFTYKIIEDLEPNERSRLHFVAAVVGAPPVIILDECTAYQKYSVQRAMYAIIHNLRKRGHAILMSSSSVESHMPVTNRLAIFVNGRIYDIDYVDNLIARYSDKGYTVVVHLKNEVDVEAMFSQYFKSFVINDVTEVLANVQVMDANLTWTKVFEIMEKLQAENYNVYSYVISVIPIDYIYNSILSSEIEKRVDLEKKSVFSKLCVNKARKVPKKETLDKLIPFEKRYYITKLKELPWSVIFHR